MSNNDPQAPATVNNFYYSVDSHDVTTTNVTNAVNVDSHDTQTTTITNTLTVDGHDVTGDGPGAPTLDSLPAEAGNLIGTTIGAATDGVQHIVDTVTTDVGGSDGLVPAAVHPIGDIVASIASFDPGNPLGALEHLGSDLGLGGANAGSEAGAADGLHSGRWLDWSDVGSILSHAVGDVASSNLDLDHLTSNLNLFDAGHVDTGADGGHHT